MPNTRASFEIKSVNLLVRDLMRPDPFIYWCDLAVSAATAWVGFFCFAGAHSLTARVLFYSVTVCAFFRCLFFIHEIAHHTTRELPGFRLFWNLLIGIPLLIPSITYEGIHLDHHRRNKYGTLEDPEYQTLGTGSRLKIAVFLAQTALIPLVFAVRFLVLGPFALLIPRLHQWLETHASSLVINERYVRKELTRQERGRMKRLESGILVFWSFVFFAYGRGLLPADFFLSAYLVMFGIGFVNQLRTLVAHRYVNDLREMTHEEQLLDTVNIEGGAFTELWAPVGARFHALHHYLPGLPYHSLPEAHRRILRAYPGSAYAAVNERSFASVLAKTWQRNKQRDILSAGAT